MFLFHKYDFNFNPSLLPFLRFSSCFNSFKLNVSIFSHPTPQQNWLWQAKKNKIKLHIVDM